MNLILASQSPRRRELIKNISNSVEFISTDTDENIAREDLSPAEYAMKLAQAKAEAAAEALAPEKLKDSIIIGCDTIVTLNDTIYGKPKDKDDAFSILRELSGKDHSVITAVCLYKDQKPVKLFPVETKVFFSELTDDDIEKYIATGDPFDKAGAYGIQNVPEHFIDHIEGDFDNVVGLPVEDLRIELSKL